jgi:N-acetylneuraminate synthase
MPAYLIAEIAQAHDGSLGLAHAFVDAAADARADAVKFQTHIAAAESTRQEPFRIRFSHQDETRYDYWKRMEFRPQDWQELARHASSRGIAFLSSPFSIEAFELLRSVGIPAWKIASGEISNPMVTDRMIADGKPLLVSTGMSTMQEVDELVSRVRGAGRDFCLLQCTSRYPTPLSEVGLNVMQAFMRRHGCPVGLSDHSGSPFPALAAIAQGASVIETHLTLDRRMFGPDVSSSLTVDEFLLVSKARDAFHELRANPVDKDALAAELHSTRALFTRSAAPTRDLDAGTVLTSDMITAKKPGTGIPAAAIKDLVGRVLRRPVAADRLFQPDDFA